MLYQEIEGFKYNDQPWPKSPKVLVLLKRYAPSMRHLGFEVEFDQKRSNDGYHVMIRKKAEPNSESEAVLEIEDGIPFSVNLVNLVNLQIQFFIPRIYIGEEI